MKAVNLIINDINVAIECPKQRPLQIVLAILRNDLRGAIAANRNFNLTIADLDKLIRHVGTHVTGQQIDRILKKWAVGR